MKSVWMKALYQRVSETSTAVGEHGLSVSGMCNKVKGMSLTALGMLGMLFSNTASAQGADAMASVATEGQRFANLAITSLGAILLVGAVIVVLAKLFQVGSSRSTWGEVMGALAGAAFIAVIGGVILALAATAAGSIAA